MILFLVGLLQLHCSTVHDSQVSLAGLGSQSLGGYEIYYQLKRRYSQPYLLPHT